MQEFRKTYITPASMTVAGVGIDHHDEFVEAIKPYFEMLDRVDAPEREQSEYIGGEWREMCEGDTTHLHLSFKGASFNDNKALCTSYVMKKLVG